MPQTTRSLSAAELDDQRVEFLPARTVMSTFWLPWSGTDVLAPYDPPTHTHTVTGDANVITTGDVTGGNGGTGGGNGGGQGGGNGGNGGAGGLGGDGGDGGNGGNGTGGNGTGGNGTGGNGGGNVG
ncbi:hypothetical protein AB0H34_24875 [Saccharopolyspora shandongensis]|uniref:hypothetical protein n=1 Tax=Saccharopolyspora shandongensis TaxID=418495 RepID=UPI0033DB3D65